MLGPTHEAKEADMDGIFRGLRDFMARLTHCAPRRRTDDDLKDWLPPVLGNSDLSSPYFLAMADRDSAWYFDRRS
jgi:hypothetical protein